MGAGGDAAGYSGLSGWSGPSGISGWSGVSPNTSGNIGPSANNVFNLGFDTSGYKGIYLTDISGGAVRFLAISGNALFISGP